MNANPKLPALLEAVRSRTPRFAKILPRDISANRFVAAVETAIVTVPGLQDCDRKSVVLACMRCAQDGLVPDGREAVLVVGRSKKDGEWINSAQYWPMSQGLQKIAYRSGLVTRLEPRVIHEGDEFSLELGSNPGIKHRPLLHSERGDIIGAYCVASLKDGGQFVEFMDVDELTAIMRRSKSFDQNKGEPKGPWATDFSEMCRKTVLRRTLKYLPSESMANRGDDEEDDASPDVELMEGPASFPRQHQERGIEITSGKPAKPADRPIEETDAQEIADAEMVIDGPPPVTARPSEPESEEVATWKVKLRDLRTSLAAAANAEEIEDTWTAWDADFDTVPPEVTAKAKELVDARLYEVTKESQ